MILDGALDPEADPMTRDVAQAAGFQQAFEDYAAWCAQQDACVLGTDPGKATAAYQALVRPLLDTPLPLAGRSGAELQRRDHRHQPGAVLAEPVGAAVRRACSTCRTATARR